MASISLRDVSIEFPIYQGSNRSLKKALLGAGTGGSLGRDGGNRVCVRALDRMTLDLQHGDRVGLVGPNGAGKTTLLRVLAGIFEPTRGQVTIEGKISPLFDVSLGFNPDAMGHENIFLRGLYMGMTPADIRSRAAEIARFSELGDYLSIPVRTYSAGMMLRLAFGVATCVDPEILLMDEWVLAGDAHFLEKARRRLEAFIERSSIMVLASHSDSILRQWCNKGVLLRRGQIEAVGPINEILALYHSRSPAGAVNGETLEAGEGIHPASAEGTPLPSVPEDVSTFWSTLSSDQHRATAAEFGYSGMIRDGRLMRFLLDTGQFEAFVWRVRAIATTPLVPDDVSRIWLELSDGRRGEIAGEFGFTGDFGDQRFLRHLKETGQLNTFFDRMRLIRADQPGNQGTSVLEAAV